jgi:hypothetical protein
VLRDDPELAGATQVAAPPVPQPPSRYLTA